MKKFIKEKYYNWLLPAIKTGFKNTIATIWEMKLLLMVLPLISFVTHLWQNYMTIKYPNDFQLNIPSMIDFLFVGFSQFLVIYIWVKFFMRLIVPKLYNFITHNFFNEITTEDKRKYATIVFFGFLFAIIWLVK